MNTICRYISLVILALAIIGVSPTPASATTITVSSVVIPNMQTALNPGETLYLVIYSDRPFISSAGIPIQAGSPANGRWYKRVTCSVVGTNVTIPSFTLDSTTDAQDIPGKAARYSAYFYANTRNLGQYGGFESFRVLPVYANPTPTDATWAQIRADNTAGAPMPIDRTTLTSEQINRLISEAVLLSGGIASIDLLTGPAITFVDDTNVTITPSGPGTLTVGWSGTQAVARGGTAASTAVGARTNLGAAGSGANTDITSLAALTTPLSGAQGGTGLASYTTGDLLYASGASALSKLAAVATGQVLVSGGVATAPAWSASPTLTAINTTNLTVTGLTTGRVPYVGLADLISDDAGFLFDATNDRLSLGTTLATNTVNLPNVGYVGGSNLAGAAIVRMIGVDASDYVSIAQGGNRSIFGGVVTQNLTGPSDLSGPDTALFHPYQNTPTSGVFATRGVYSSNGAGNNFHLSSYATTAGTRHTVAIFGEAVALDVAGTSAFGLNPVAYTVATGTNASVVYGMEVDVGVLGNSTNAEAYGLVIATNGAAAPYGTVAGTVKNYLQMQVTTGADITAAPANGIVFNSGGGVNVIQTSGSLIKVGTPGTTGTYGLDLQNFNASNGAAIFSNGDALVGLNAANTIAMNTIGYTTADYLQIGYGTYAAAGQLGITIHPGSAETIRITRGASTSEVGNIGLNQASPTAQLHQTTAVKRALTATVNTFSITNGSPNLTVTAGAFLTEVAPGSSIEISAQAGTYYTVLSVTDNDNLVLTSNYTGSTTTTSNGKTDYRPLYITNANAGTPDPWFEVDNYHAFVAYGNSTYDDLRGMIRLVARATPAKQMALGVDNTGSYGYISSFQSSVGWKPLILQGGAAGTDTGGVVIGSPTPSANGAMLKVEGSGAKTANNVSTEFNNIATSVSSFQKVAAQYISSGSWVGPNISGYFASLGAVEGTGDDRSNVPVAALGGKSFFGPHGNQVATPAPFSTLLPTATVDIYGYATEVVTIGADTGAVDAAGVMAGTGTTWNTVGNTDRLRPGDAVMFGTDTEVYEIGTITSGTAAALSTAYNGTPASGLEVYRDPYLLRLRNSYGTERFRVESSGFTKLTGTFVGLQSTIASAAALPLSNGNVFLVTGNTTVTSVAFFNLATDTSQIGRIVTLVWDAGATFDVTSGAALQLEGGTDITAYTAGDTLTILNIDGTNWVAVAQSDNAP